MVEDELLTRIRALSGLPDPWVTNLGAAAGGCCLTVGLAVAYLRGAAWLWLAALGLALLGLVVILLSSPVCDRRFERRRVATIRAWRTEHR